MLANKGLCNLTTINLMNFVDKKGKVLHEKLYNAIYHAARVGVRVTLQELELPEWNKVQKRDRLLGVSLTGVQDFFNKTEMNKYAQEYFLNMVRSTATKAGNEYCDKLGVNEPLFITSQKPSGTVSQLPTVSTGIEYSFAPYYIRRVRVNAINPISDALKDLGYELIPDNGCDQEDPDTWVVEFPVKAPEGKTKKDITAIEQLENYKSFMEHYVDQNASITVTVKDDEWEEVEEWLWKNWDLVIGITLISDVDSDYQLLPYEEITEREYRGLIEELPREITAEDIAKFENMYEEIETKEDGCAGGSCPIK